VSRGSGVVLGVSCDFHDAAAALLVDGRVVAAAEEERFSRVKHDAGLPEAATRACLEVAGLGADEIDHVVFYEKPLLVASRFLATKQAQGPWGYRSFVRDAPQVFGRSLMVGYRVAAMLRRLGAPSPPTVRFLEHHLSHAASAYLPSPFERACVVTIDGIGEWATATIGVGSHHRLELLEELRFPDSLGLLYSFVTAYCGFRPNRDEYQLMGLAPYGHPRFVDELSQLAGIGPDGAPTVRARDLRWYASSALERRALHGLLGGPPRRRDEPLTERDADLAASVQQLIEQAVLRIAARAHDLTGETAVCLAGGVALNCVANGRLLREGPFEELWVQPAAGDAGGALGAALAYWHLELGHRRDVATPDAMSGALLGPEPGEDRIAAALDGAEVPHRRLDEGALVAEVARRLADGEVVAWCRGRMEYGPRALGSRSILADPRRPDVRARLNAMVKGREEFRPFAPAVLAEHAAEWFELDHPSPYMLVVAPVRSDRLRSVETEPEGFEARAAVPRSEIPACTHVDGSARVQTVTQASSPALRRLLEAFHELTGCPILVNTSFNRAGEPIVESPAQALASAAAGGVDLLVLGDRLVEGADLLAGAANPADQPTGAPA